MTITPYLYYEDLDATMKWLAKAFGFKRVGPVMKGEDGKANHAAMRLGKAVVMMGRPGRGYKNPKRAKHATHSLYVTVLDADALFLRARRAGGKILEEPENTEYGHRRWGMEDPEGQQWYFAHMLKAGRRRRRSGQA